MKYSRLLANTVSDSQSINAVYFVPKLNFVASCILLAVFDMILHELKVEFADTIDRG